jgi:hypothetical protein
MWIFPKSRIAVRICTSAKDTATVANHTFRLMVAVKKSV